MSDTVCEKCKVNKYCGTCITCEQAKEMYEKGRADKYQEIVSEYMLLTEKQVADIRADAIEEFRNKLFGSKDGFTDDLLNMGYTKGKKDGYEQGRKDVIDEIKKWLEMEFDEHNKTNSKFIRTIVLNESVFMLLEQMKEGAE